MSAVQPSNLKAWVPDEKDFSHFGRYQEFYGSTMAPVFPTTLGRKRRAILDQGMSDECTDFQGAVRAGYRFGLDMSRKWHGAKEGEIVNQLIINGTDPRTAMKVPLSFGSLPVTAEPVLDQSADPHFYLDWHNWPLSIDKLAARQLEVAYNYIDGPYDHFDNIREALQQAYTENQVALVFSSWFPEWNETNGIIPVPTSQPIANHASLFIDFNLINGEPMLVNHLSQGTSFGASGFGYFSRAVVNQQVENGNMGVYIFREHPSQAALADTITTLEGEILDFGKRLLTAWTKS